MLTTSLKAEVVFALAALVISSCVTVRSRSILKGGLCLYGLFVLWAVLTYVFVPGLMVVLKVDDGLITGVFSEATDALPVVLLSWIPAFIAAALVHLVHAASTRTLNASGLWASGNRLVRLARRLHLLPPGTSAHSETRAVYPKWVGVVLGFLLTGSAHFLSGRRRAGIAWYLSRLALGYVTLCLIVLRLIVLPGHRGLWGIGLACLLGLVLWITMLKQSYRPVRRIGVLGWFAVLAVGMSLDATERWVTRFAVEPFSITSGSMQPTLKGIHAREIPGGQTAHAGVVARLVRGERYVRWVAKTSGAFGGPHYPGGNLWAWREYWVGRDMRYLPPDIKTRFRQGQHIARGDLVWSGMVVAGDKIMAEKVSYLFRSPRRGELAVFKTGSLPRWGEDRCVVFRVAGLPGERVRIEPPWLIVNSQRVTDPPIFATIAAKEQGYAGFLSPHDRDKDANSPSEEIVLGDGEYFVLGDDTRTANDSRYRGPVTRNAFVGRVTRIYWPLDRIYALDGKW